MDGPILYCYIVLENNRKQKNILSNYGTAWNPKMLQCIILYLLKLATAGTYLLFSKKIKIN